VVKLQATFGFTQNDLMHCCVPEVIFFAIYMYLSIKFCLPDLYSVMFM